MHFVLLPSLFPVVQSGRQATQCADPDEVQLCRNEGTVRLIPEVVGHQCGGVPLVMVVVVVPRHLPLVTALFNQNKGEWWAHFNENYFPMISCCRSDIFHTIVHTVVHMFIT